MFERSARPRRLNIVRTPCAFSNPIFAQKISSTHAWITFFPIIGALHRRPPLARISPPYPSAGAIPEMVVEDFSNSSFSALCCPSLHWRNPSMRRSQRFSPVAALLRCASPARLQHATLKIPVEYSRREHLVRKAYQSRHRWGVRDSDKTLPAMDTTPSRAIDTVVSFCRRSSMSPA